MACGIYFCLLFPDVADDAYVAISVIAAILSGATVVMLCHVATTLNSPVAFTIFLLIVVRESLFLPAMIAAAMEGYFKATAVPYLVLTLDTAVALSSTWLSCAGWQRISALSRGSTRATLTRSVIPGGWSDANVDMDVRWHESYDDVSSQADSHAAELTTFPATGEMSGVQYGAV